MLPRTGGWGYPQDPLRVAAGRDDKEEQGGARAFLPKDLPSMVGAPGPREGGDRRGSAQPPGVWLASGGAGYQVRSLAKVSHMTAYGRVRLVPSYTGLVGRGWEGVLPAPCTKIGTSPTSTPMSIGCRR